MKKTREVTVPTDSRVRGPAMIGVISHIELAGAVVDVRVKIDGQGEYQIPVGLLLAAARRKERFVKGSAVVVSFGDPNQQKVSGGVLVSPGLPQLVVVDFTTRH